MRKKGFATSAILYTLLLLFIVLLVGILNNLQNKKTVLDQLKVNTVNALQYGSELESLLERVANMESEIEDLKKKDTDFVELQSVANQAQLDEALSIENCSTGTITHQRIYVMQGGLSLPGGTWFVETGCTGTGKYAYQIAKVYSRNSGMTIQVRSFYDGKATAWVTIS